MKAFYLASAARHIRLATIYLTTNPAQAAYHLNEAERCNNEATGAR